MKALQITAPGEYVVKDVPMPSPGEGEVLLKVLAVTTCPHWDMHILGGEPMLPGLALEYPYTAGQPGHEACGDIEAVGPGVTSVRPGDRVCAWIDPGHHLPGCYAQYVVKPEKHVIPVPAELPPENCAPLELAMCASAYLLTAGQMVPAAGKRVGVFGLGPAGLIFVQLLKAAGAEHILTVDPLPERRELALSMGADESLDPRSDEATNLPWFHEPGGLDLSFDCVGKPEVVHRAMELTRSAVSLFAVQREPYTFPPHGWGRLVLLGAGPHRREAAEYAAERLADGRLDLAPFVTHTMPLQDYGHAVDLLREQKALKVAFLPQES